MSVFKPTGTTQALLKAVKPYIKGGKLLDLACGCGIVGGELSSQVDETYASDVSFEAVSHAAKQYPKIDVRVGNLFEPWVDKRFNYIVDDVSGVAEEIAKVSPWFDGVPCNSGKDGADLVVKVLKEAPKHLGDGGKLFFPIVSLSNADRILNAAYGLYRIKLLSHTDFPLPKEMYKHIDLLRELRKEGIRFQEKFGMVLFSTDIYMAGKI